MAPTRIVLPVGIQPPVGRWRLKRGVVGPQILGSDAILEVRAERGELTVAKEHPVLFPDVGIDVELMSAVIDEDGIDDAIIILSSPQFLPSQQVASLMHHFCLVEVLTCCFLVASLFALVLIPVPQIKMFRRGLVMVLFGWVGATKAAECLVGCELQLIDPFDSEGLVIWEERGACDATSTGCAVSTVR